MAAQLPASAADAVAKQFAATALQDGGPSDDGDGDDDGGVRLEPAEAAEPVASSQTQPGAGQKTGQAAPEAPPLDTAAASSRAPLTQRPPPTHRPRTWTSTAEIDSAVARPGTVRINVKGAFIVDEDLAGNASSPTSETGEPNRRPSRTRNGGGRAHSPSEAHGTFDIRLPNHHAVVSHIAVDVSTALLVATHCCQRGADAATIIARGGAEANKGRSAARSPRLSTSRGRPSPPSPAAASTSSASRPTASTNASTSSLISSSAICPATARRRASCASWPRAAAPTSTTTASASAWASTS